MDSTSSQSPSPTLVGIAEMAVLADAEHPLVTHALGSCIGITLYDPVARVAGLLHFMLPFPPRTAKAKERPSAFYGSTGVPEFFRAAYREGAEKERLVVCAAGGASLMGDDDVFQIGKRNRVLLRRLFWKNKIKLAGQSLGGHEARTLQIDPADGRVRVRSNTGEEVLWQNS